MDIARNAAVEIDRLVMSLNSRVNQDHGRRLREAAGRLDLGSLDMLPHFEDWLMAGTLTRELALLRLRYRPPEAVHARLDELEAKGFVAAGEHGLAATADLVPMLEELLAARAAVARDTWGGYERKIDTVTRLGKVVADAASPEHVVAVSHRALPEPGDPYLLLEHRLFTLRYIRQHDHAAAWQEHGLTAPQMVVFTRLWHGEPPGDDQGAVLAELVEAGLATADPRGLAPHGRALREEIEDETNRLAQLSFDVLGGGGADELLGALRSLPSAA